MSKAPSEKHLEDWVVNNPDVVIGQEEGYRMFRQYGLPSGITDLIFYGGSRPIVLVELKKDEINAKTLAQALRYMRDLKEIAKIALGIIRHPLHPEGRFYDPKIHGVLIGSSIKDENLLIAAEAGDIEVMTYEYDSESDTYEFTDHSTQHVPLDIRLSYAEGPLGTAIQDAFVANVKRREELNGYPDFTDLLELLELNRIEKDHGVMPVWRWVEEGRPGLNEEGGTDEIR